MGAAGRWPGYAVAVLVMVQLAAGTGFYAVVAHLVVYLHQDLGLLASAVALVVGVRTAVQYALYLPAGVLADRFGVVRAGALGCLVRAAGFALLAPATDLAGLLTASILIGVGGSLYTPASQALMARLPPGWPARAFAWYFAAGHVASVAGPVVGLVLMTGAFPRSGGTAGSPDTAAGFGGVVWLSAGLWALAGLLLSTLRHAGPRTGTGPVGKVRSPSATGPPPATASPLGLALRDRELIRLAAVTSPVTLLVTQGTVIVPLVVREPSVVTAFLTTGATVAVAAQLPRVRVLARRLGVRLGFAGLGTAYLLMLPAALSPGAPPHAMVLAAAVVFGAAQGVLAPALFHWTVRLAPADAAGVYFGVRAFAAGLVAFGGGLAVGYVFERVPTGGVVALLGLAAVAATASGAVRGEPNPATVCRASA